MCVCEIRLAGIKPTSSILLLPFASDDSKSSISFFLGRIEFGRWCMDPNDRLWIENSLVLTLSVNSCCLSGGVYRVYDTDSGVDILVIVALAGIMYDGLTSRGTGRGGKERYSV